MKETSNYKLNQWEHQDRIQMEDFNSDNAKVDAALAAVNGRVDTLAAGKAEQSAVNAEAAARQNADNAEKQAREALAGVVSQKADTSTMRAENLWVKLGETTLGGGADRMEVTASNAGQYRAFFLCFSGSGPHTIHLVLNGSSHELAKTSSSYATSYVMGRAAILRGRNRGVTVEGSTFLDDQSTNWGRNASYMDQGATISGNLSVQLTTSGGGFNAGTHLVVYGLKA